VFQMFHIRTQVALRALPVDTVAGAMVARGGLARFCFRSFPSPRDNTAPLRRQFGGTAIPH
jgi:hypothetical protein